MHPYLGISAYQNAATTVSPGRQIIMLYEGMIKHIKQAKEAIRDNRIEDRYHALDKAGKIAMGLLAALDFTHSQTLAESLQRFYSSIDMRLLYIQRNNDLGICDQLVKDISRMKQTWEEVEQG